MEQNKLRGLVLYYLNLSANWIDTLGRSEVFADNSFRAKGFLFGFIYVCVLS